jgi:electron transport complex protein RnfC
VGSYSFHGGVHPPEYKELTENCAFEIIPLPEEIILPLSQHLGKEASPQVKRVTTLFPVSLLQKPRDLFQHPFIHLLPGR